MSRLTISLPPELHAALKSGATRPGTTIGIKSGRAARALVAAARTRSGLTVAEAEPLALEETREANILTRHGCGSARRRRPSQLG